MSPTAPRMLQHFELGPTLGAGLQGKVKLALDTRTSTHVALKIIDAAKLTAKSKLNLYREVEAMQRVAHPNVLRLQAVLDQVEYPRKHGGAPKTVVLIVLEVATGGELFDFMMYTGRFDERTARAYFQQLVAGLAACHAQGVFHRDIKPENLLLDQDFALKIADFGLSALKQRDDGALEELYTQCGTRSYMSPEVLAGVPYQGAPADVWAAGVVLFIMLAGFPPFQMATRQDWWFRACAARQYKSFWDAHSRTATFSPGAMALLTRVFAVDPAERITLEEIQQDPWFNEATVDADTFRAELEVRKRQVDEEKRRERESELLHRKEVSGSDDPFAHEQKEYVHRSIDVQAPVYPTEGVTLYTCFRSKQRPVEVFERVEGALDKVSAEFTANVERYKIKATMKKEGVTFTARIYALASSADRCVVEFRRTSGEHAKFRDVYASLSKELADLVWDEQDPDFSEDIISDEARMI